MITYYPKETKMEVETVLWKKSIKNKIKSTEQKDFFQLNFNGMKNILQRTLSLLLVWKINRHILRAKRLKKNTHGGTKRTTP